MQNKIEELKQQIEALKKELLALPSVELKSDIDNLQSYIRISTELLKAVASFQVLQNIEEEKVAVTEEPVPEPTPEPTSELIPEAIEEEKPEIGTLESVIAEEETPVYVEPEPVRVAPEPTVNSEKPAGIEVAEMLANNAIDDLRSAFGLNERFYFTNEIFGGDGQEFVRAINEFNHLSSFEDAERLIVAKFIPQFGWKENDEIVEEFVAVIKRRYS